MANMKTLSDGKNIFTVYDESAIHLSEGKMQNDLAMGNHKIVELATPENDTDASNKKYIDDEIKKAKTESKNYTDQNIKVSVSGNVNQAIIHNDNYDGSGEGTQRVDITVRSDGEEYTFVVQDAGLGLYNKNKESFDGEIPWSCLTEAVKQHVHDSIFSIFSFGSEQNLTDALNVNLVNQKGTPSFSIIASENHSSISGLPNIINGDSIRQFYAYRMCLPIPQSNGSGPNYHYIVLMFEMYPDPGRVWKNVYNVDARTWTGWTYFKGTADSVS